MFQDQVSGECFQDHWSPGFKELLAFKAISLTLESKIQHRQFLVFLAHLSIWLIGELKVYPCSGVHLLLSVVVHNAKTLLRNNLANQSQILC